MNDDQHGTAKFNYDSPEISRYIQPEPLYPSNDLHISNFGLLSSEIRKNYEKNGGTNNGVINFRDEANIKN